MRKNKYEDEFAKFCEATYEDLKVKIYAKIGDKYATEEVIQETYRIASEAKEKILSHPQPEGWLYITAANIYKNKMRKNIKTQNNETEFLEEEVADFEADGDSIETAKEILSSLGENDREILELHYFEGLSLKEIAEKRNISYASLQKHIYRLLQKIRKIFSEK